MIHLSRPSSTLDIADLLRIQDEALDRAEVVLRSIAGIKKFGLGGDLSVKAELSPVQPNRVSQ